MAYKKILLAIDVYEKTDILVNSAIGFAKKNNVSQIQIVFVVNGVTPIAPSILDFQSSIEKEARKKLDEVVAKIVDIEIKHKVLVGRPASEIVFYADENNCDLIVLGSHATHGASLLLGSVANAVLHKATCDVLTIRISKNQSPGHVKDYKKLLVSTDLENDSCMVAAKANEVAKLYNASVDAVFVIPNDSISFMVYETTKVESAMEKFVKTNNIAGERSVLIGEVSKSISKKTKENCNDLIVIGSHRRSAIGRLFLGSTANSILHEANINILVVRLK